MNKLLVLTAVVSLFFACNAKEETAAEAAHTHEPEVITDVEARNFLNDYDAMWGRRDTIAMKNAMWDNYLYFTSTGVTRDRATLLGWFNPANKYQVDTATRSEIKVFIKDNIAILSTRWQGSGSFAGERFRDDQRCGLVIQKMNGVIRLLSEHCTQIEK